MSYDQSINFYHGKLSREDATKLLKDYGGSNGTFLVRDSTTSVGDYVLSVFNDNEVIHYQIRKHEDDAFFSIEQTIFHGLETLIEYYQKPNHILVTSLKDPILKYPPPHDTMTHGRTNLLHRATREGNFNVVKELLTCGYRSLEAKNEDGQTAVHLASQLSHNIILEKLINSGANVNCRDSGGYTPLHYACHCNDSNTLKILIEKGGAHVQMRNTKTNWVALHEAASRGYIECIKILLSHNAPLRPRTLLNELPIDLARKNGHQKCVDHLLQYKYPLPITKKSEWYHGTLGRNQAKELLKQRSNNNDGAFLVRYSDRSGYVLSMMYLEVDYHFPIQIQDHYYYIDDGPYLDSLESLIEYYMTISDGLPVKLHSPITPDPSPPLPSTPHPSLSNSTSTLFKVRKELSNGVITEESQNILHNDKLRMHNN